MDSISAMEEEMRGYTDLELRQKTEAFKERLRNGAQLDDLLIEAFAVNELHLTLFASRLTKA